MRRIKSPASDIRKFATDIMIFDSMADLSGYASANYSGEHAQDNDRPEFYGGTYGKACERTLRGDLSLVEESDRLMSKFEQLAYDTQRRSWTDDVVGAIPNVPAFVAGHPLNMRRRTAAASDVAPIVVYVDLFASCGFSHKQIAARGAAALALVRILSMRRPVELFAGCSTEGREGTKLHISPIVKIDSTPLDLARAAYALTSPEFLRRVMFGMCHHMGAKKHIFAPEHYFGRAAFAPALGEGELLLLPPMIGAPSYSDALAWNDPERWIAEKIRAAAPEILEAA